MDKPTKTVDSLDNSMKARLLPSKKSGFTTPMRENTEDSAKYQTT